MPFSAPDDTARVMVQHDSHILVPLLVRSLIDTDANEAIEAVASFGIEPVVNALADRPYALPVDAHELGDDAAVAVNTKPCDLLLEGMGEARCVVRPGNGCGDNAMLGALDAKGRVLEVGHRRAEVERAPAAWALRAVMDGRSAVAVRAAAALALARRNADNEPTFFQSHGFNDGAGDAEQYGEYPLDGHGDILYSVSFC